MEYLLSVRLMAFNHERFIGDALLGIFSQKVNFKIEIVIGDDFSDDKTLEIAKSFKDTENIHVKILKRVKKDPYSEERIKRGRLYNFKNILENCKGKYIALLDGDDYWNDNYKLQRQVQFLEENDDYFMCFHNTEERFDDCSKPSSLYLSSNQSLEITLNDLAYRNLIPTCSVVFRNQMKGQMPDWILEQSIGDWPLHIHNAHFGRMRYFPCVMGVHRLHDGGVSSLKPLLSNIEMVLKTYDKLIEVYKDEMEFLGHLEKARREMQMNQEALMNKEGPVRDSLLKRVLRKFRIL